MLELVAQAAEALHAAHEQGIVHRDVKPANLLLRRSGALVLTDFGIARTQSGTQLTVTGEVPGTLSYLAPEQLLGHPTNPLSDVYALGVIAHEALAGERPFMRDNAFASAMARVQELPPALPAGVPAPVAAIVHRALAADPAHRWPSAAALAAACRQAAIDSDPTASATPGSPATIAPGTVHSYPTIHSAPTALPHHPYHPAGAALPPDRQQVPQQPRGRWVAVGLVGLASALLYSALILTEGNVGVDILIVGMALIAAVLLLATRRPGGAGLLAGLLAWAWLDFTFWTVDHRIPHWSWERTWLDRAWFGANLLSLLTVLLAVIWLVCSRDSRPSRHPRYVAVTTVAGLLAVMTTLLASRSLPEQYLPYLLEAPYPDALLLPLVMVVMVGCAAALPVVLFAAPGRAAARLAAVGWLLGGGQFGVTQMFGWLFGRLLGIDAARWHVLAPVVGHHGDRAHRNRAPGRSSPLAELSTQLAGRCAPTVTRKHFGGYSPGRHPETFLRGANPVPDRGYAARVAHTQTLTFSGSTLTKRYTSWDRGEPRREWSALQHLHRHAPDLVPEPLAADLHRMRETATFDARQTGLCKINSGRTSARAGRGRARAYIVTVVTHNGHYVAAEQTLSRRQPPAPAPGGQLRWHDADHSPARRSRISSPGWAALPHR